MRSLSKRRILSPESADLSRRNQTLTPEHPIILCGFTSSGKTTIGKLLSEQLGLPFYDTDQMLIEHYKMTIPEIFAEGGESLFRDYEHEIARQVCGLGLSGGLPPEAEC